MKIIPLHARGGGGVLKKAVCDGEKFQQVKKAGSESVIYVRMMEWRRELWTVRCWNGKVVKQCCYCDQVCLYYGTMSGIMMMMSGTIMILEWQPETDYVWGNDNWETMPTVLSAWICRFVGTVSVMMWFAQNSQNGIGMMLGFHRCCGIDNPVRLIVLDIW